jgi:hypothetical protein
MSVVRACKNDKCTLKVRDGQTCECGLSAPMPKQTTEFESLGSLKPSFWLQLITGFMLFGALGDAPSEYYVFLRVVVFVASLWNIKKFYKDSEHDNFASFVVICSAIILVLFNPIIPIYMWEKTKWILPDIFAGIFFILVAFYDYEIIDKKTEDAQSKEKK